MMCLPITGHVAGSVAAAGGGGESVGVVIEEPRDPVGVVQLDIEMPPLPVREFRGRPGAGRIIVEARAQGRAIDAAPGPTRNDASGCASKTIASCRRAGALRGPPIAPKAAPSGSRLRNLARCRPCLNQMRQKRTHEPKVFSSW